METANDLSYQVRPSIQEWLRENRRSSINDYYRIFGAQEVQSTKSPSNAPIAPQMSFSDSNSYHTENHITINNTVVSMPKKSVAVAIILTFLFGPLGLFYASFWGVFLMIVLDVVAFLLLTPSMFSVSSIGGSFAAIGLIGGLIWLVLVQWPTCMLWALVACIRHNRQIREMAFTLL